MKRVTILITLIMLLLPLTLQATDLSTMTGRWVMTQDMSSDNLETITGRWDMMTIIDKWDMMTILETITGRWDMMTITGKWDMMFEYPDGSVPVGTLSQFKYQDKLITGLFLILNDEFIFIGQDQNGYPVIGKKTN